MADLTTNSLATGTPLVDRIRGALRREIAAFRLGMARRQVFQTALAELKALDADTRMDLGLSCSDLYRVAHEQAMKVN